MKSCGCDEYGHLEFDRKTISKRIRQTPDIIGEFKLVTAVTSGAHTLYRCPKCGQLWQQSFAWSWGSRPYAFRVPRIGWREWLKRQYVHPSDILEFMWVMSEFLQQRFTRSRRTCTNLDCSEKAIQLSVHCLKHHVQALQKAELLPPNPAGRWFGPYTRKRCLPPL